MKISEMLEREDFYPSIERTLNQYWGYKTSATKLITNKNYSFTKNFGYVYEYLNAIIARNPDKQVKQFLLTEYKTRTLVKRIFAFCYLQVLLNTRGLFANKYFQTIIENELPAHILIYPCNKKIRIFNFKEQYVDVVVKDGFSDNLILKEIEFRENINSAHVLPIMSKTPNSYRESIIDGKPLARITNNKSYQKFKYMSYNILKTEISNTVCLIEAGSYLDKLFAEFKAKITGYNLDSLTDSFERLKNLALKYFDMIPTVMSHGDFHHGNIWIENRTENIYIIDFETYRNRSVYYDYYTLYYDLRTYEFNISLKKLLEKKQNVVDNRHIAGVIALVLLEDFIFQVEDLQYFKNVSKINEITSYQCKVDDIVLEIENYA